MVDAEVDRGAFSVPDDTVVISAVEVYIDVVEQVVAAWVLAFLAFAAACAR